MIQRTHCSILGLVAALLTLPASSLFAGDSVGVGAAPEEGAEVLFDGSREMLDEKWTYWEGPRFQSSLPIKWKIVDDPVDDGTVLMTDDPVAAGGKYGTADVVTKKKFRDFRLHIEFLVSKPRGNSGVYLQNRYEIQILDGDRTKHGMGAVINETPSPYHAYNGVGKWNAYDVTFRAARFKDGERVEKALVTVYFNGQLVHVNQPIRKVWGGPNSGIDGGNKGGEGITDVPGGLKLQCEGHDVRYRNIWIRELDLEAAETRFGGPSHSAVRPAPRGGGWMGRHESFNERVARGNVDLIFVGDSITQGWEGAGKGVWAKYYGERNAVNLGIGGDRTQHVLWRLDHGNVEGIAPKAAVVMIGTNNSGGGRNNAGEMAGRRHGRRRDATCKASHDEDSAARYLSTRRTIQRATRQDPAGQSDDSEAGRRRVRSLPRHRSRVFSRRTGRPVARSCPISFTSRRRGTRSGRRPSSRSSLDCWSRDACARGARACVSAARSVNAFRFPRVECRSLGRSATTSRSGTPPSSWARTTQRLPKRPRWLRCWTRRSVRPDRPWDRLADSR